MTETKALTPEIEARFWRRVDKSKSCWEWHSDGSKGYGRFALYGRMEQAHRVAWELVKGPIPSGMQIDHICRNRLCVNPDHLEPVTAKVNYLRGVGVGAINARKTTCHRGHPLAGDNICQTELPRRKCRECRNLRARAKYRRFREQLRALCPPSPRRLSDTEISEIKASPLGSRKLARMYLVPDGRIRAIRRGVKAVV